MRETVRLEPPLRRARKEDSRRVAELMNIAGHSLPAYVWSLSAGEGQEPIEVGTERAAREDGNFSYRNSVVAEEDDEVVAMVLAYRLPEVGEENLDELPEVLRPLIELELLVPGTFYVNGLAALPRYQGRGLGSKLLDAATALAADAGCDELSIQVFEQNESAVRLYERYGYRTVARRPVVPHPSYPYDGDVLLMTRRTVRARGPRRLRQADDGWKPRGLAGSS
jgi:ribosomal protein S18 acetylase RimI-like enzyme